jgi:hypothetical protein
VDEAKSVSVVFGKEGGVRCVTLVDVTVGSDLAGANKMMFELGQGLQSRIGAGYKGLRRDGDSVVVTYVEVSKPFVSSVLRDMGFSPEETEQVAA